MFLKYSFLIPFLFSLNKLILFFKYKWEKAKHQESLFFKKPWTWSSSPEEKMGSSQKELLISPMVIVYGHQPNPVSHFTKPIRQAQ